MFKSIEEVMTDSARAIREQNARDGGGVSKVPKYIKAGYAQRVPDKALILLYSLHEYVNTNTGDCYVSQNILAESLGCDNRTIIRHMLTLSDKGFIKVIPAKNKDRKGKLVNASNQIIIVPFTKIDDIDYHREINALIDSIEYLIVESQSNKRIIVGFKPADSYSGEEPNEFKPEIQKRAVPSVQSHEGTSSSGKVISLEDVTRPPKISNIQNNNLMKPDIEYLHPKLRAPIIPSTITLLDDGTSIRKSGEVGFKPSYFSFEEIVRYFYELFPNNEQNMTRDIGAIKCMYIDFEKAADAEGIETLDLILFTISCAEASTFDSDSRVRKIFDIKDFIDDAVYNYFRKKEALMDCGII